jgi:Bifunctional DNA primase/polymerase, N-terminal/Primase C terminal 1 (PriCT-1)
MSALLKAALTLAERGMHIFPCAPRSKVPMTTNGVLAATRNYDTIRAWWKSNPELNVAVACGARSQVWALDVDGETGEHSLRELEQIHGPLPSSVESITPRPGRHILFAWRPGIGNSVGTLAPGIDTRGEHGYCVLPPSVTYGPYHWSVDSANAIVDAPTWLTDKVCKLQVSTMLAALPGPYREFMKGVEQGARNTSLTRICGYLLARRVDAVVTHELLQIFNTTRCHPPLPAKDVTRIVASICKREMSKLGQTP